MNHLLRTSDDTCSRRQCIELHAYHSTWFGATCGLEMLSFSVECGIAPRGIAEQLNPLAVGLGTHNKHVGTIDDVGQCLGGLLQSGTVGFSSDSHYSRRVLRLEDAGCQCVAQLLVRGHTAGNGSHRGDEHNDGEKQQLSHICLQR